MIFLKKVDIYFASLKNTSIFAPVIKNAGAIAQLVEQRTENPCVPGSIPGGTTDNQAVTFKVTAFFMSFSFSLQFPLFYVFFVVCLNQCLNHGYNINVVCCKSKVLKT